MGLRFGQFDNGRMLETACLDGGAGLFLQSLHAGEVRRKLPAKILS